MRRLLLKEGIAVLTAAKVASPEVDAVELLVHALHTTRKDLILIEDVSEIDAIEYRRLIEQRAQRVPLQHLTGVAYFRHVELAVGPGVFVPRPETEVMTGWVLENAQLIAGEGHGVTIVDLCTGSGAIAKAIAHEAPWAHVHAVELSEDAYGYAARNLADTGVDLRQGDMADAFPELSGSVDIVVCNPPYIPFGAWESVETEARDFDPVLALYSGYDGLDAMRVLENTAARLLKPGGLLAAEHADAQGPEADPPQLSAMSVFVHAGRWSHIHDHNDLAGRPRFVSATLARAV